MAFSIVSRGLLRTSREILDRGVVGAVTILNGNVDIDINRSVMTPQRNASTTSATALTLYTRPSLLNGTNATNALIDSIRQYSKDPVPAPSQRKEESESDSEFDDEFERQRQKLHKKYSERGDSEFWRRKMRTLHKILDVNKDGVVSFEDFNLLAKRFTDLGHLTPEVSAEFMEVMKLTWEEHFQDINPYKTAEQFLADFHHRLNDKKMAKRIGRFLPYLFKAVDYDHSGHLDLDQYKLFFRCLGLTDEDAAISFAVIDKNGDGQISLKEFMHLGTQFFLTEDETKISKMFWGPLVDH